MKEIEPKKVVAAITHGDINGIGYEVILKTLADNRVFDFCIPVLYGSSKAAAYHRKTISINEYQITLAKDLQQLRQDKAYLLNITNDDIQIELGKPNNIAGKLAHKALEMALSDINSKQADILVTAPINKHNIQSEQFKFNGHTDFLASKYKTQNYMMLLVSPHIKVGLVTEHLAVKDISTTITTKLIENKLSILFASLKNDFDISNPKIAVLGLNPHASDEALLGDEETNIINPAIKNAFNNKINAFGPFAADGFFASGAYRNFDAVLAMYHDQGLIPFKMLSFEDGINFTAGLPIVRTSPAHGTAYDIAGKDLASCNSFRNALLLGVEIFNNRQKLKKQNQ